MSFAAPAWRHPMKRCRWSNRSRAICEAVEPRTMLCMSEVSDSILAQDLAAEQQRSATSELKGEPGASQFFDISWSNRGSPTNDSDNFNAVFGAARAEVARNVVEAAIEAWEYAIVDIHGQGGRNWIGVDVYMDTGKSGHGGGAYIEETDDFGIPIRGDITFSSGTSSRDADLPAGTPWPDRGWYLDPTPSDHSEYTGGITNAFAGQANAASPASSLYDLYTVMVSELAHLVGVSTAN